MPAPKWPIKEEMADITSKTKNTFLEDHTLKRNIDSMYIELFVLLEKIESISKEEKLAILVLAARNFGLLYCSTDCIYNGYYHSGMILLRAACENEQLMRYFTGNNEAAKKWFKGRRYHPRDVRRKIKDKTKGYYFLSDYYVHPNVEAAFTSVIRSFSENKISVEYYPYFSEDECRRGLRLNIIMSWLSILHLQYEFRDYLWKNENWKDRFITLNEAVMDYVDRIHFDKNG